MKITYNSPVVLTFTLISTVVMLVTSLMDSAFATTYFAVGYPFISTDPLSWFRMISHIAGHSGWPHLFGNFTMILLVGPMLEEKYSTWELFEMIMVTGATTGILQMYLFPHSILLGASGVVFMMIILSSMVNKRAGEIPATFILVSILFLGSEIATAFKPDNISHFTHIVGGLCGAAFGFLIDKRASRGTPQGITIGSIDDISID